METIDIEHDYRDDYRDEDLEYERERERRGIHIARQIDEWISFTAGDR
jgi:hypothetical protein